MENGGCRTCCCSRAEVRRALPPSGAGEAKRNPMRLVLVSLLILFAQFWSST